jgi:hypothetical protein
MQWVHRIRRKISAALLLTAIFVLVFVKNIVENKYVNELGASFASVYEDRLVVEGYIFRLSDHLFRKKIMLDTSKRQDDAAKIKSAIDNHNTAINGLIEEYEKTKLTKAEHTAFADLKTNLHEMRTLERAYLQSVDLGHGIPEAKARIDDNFNETSKNLRDLSAIQISEGKLLNDHSKKIIAGSSLLTQFELGILIAIGLMIVVLIFESTSVFSRTTPAHKESLN